MAVLSIQIGGEPRVDLIGRTGAEVEDANRHKHRLGKDYQRSGA